MQQAIRDRYEELADLSPSDRETVLRETCIREEFHAHMESLLGFDSLADGAAREVSRREPYHVVQLTRPVPSLWYVSYEFCRQMFIAFIVSFRPRRKYSQSTLARDERSTAAFSGAHTQARSAVPSR